MARTLQARGLDILLRSLLGDRAAVQTPPRRRKDTNQAIDRSPANLNPSQNPLFDPCGGRIAKHQRMSLGR